MLVISEPGPFWVSCLKRHDEYTQGILRHEIWQAKLARENSEQKSDGGNNEQMNKLVFRLWKNSPFCIWFPRLKSSGDMTADQLRG